MYAGDDWKRAQPSTKKLNTSYLVWRTVLKRRGIVFGRASIKWQSHGVFTKYWRLEDDGTWTKVKQLTKPVLIEDRTRGFHPETGIHEIKTYLEKLDIVRHVPIFNYPEFTDLIDSKLNQSALFYGHMPQTRLWLPGDELQNPQSKRLVLKGISGFGGDFVEITTAKRIKFKHMRIEQEFVKASKNGQLKDTRIVFIGSKPIYSFQRSAPKGSFLTNIHLGGSFSFIPLSTIRPLVQHAKKLAQILDVFPKRLFSLDFMIDSRSGKPYLIECNSKPTREPLRGAIARTYFEALAKHIYS